MVVLYEDILLPPFVFALGSVGIVVLTPFGLMPLKLSSVFVWEYEGVVGVEIMNSLAVVVVVEKIGVLPLKSGSPLFPGGRVTSGGCIVVLRCAVSSEWLRT